MKDPKVAAFLLEQELPPQPTVSTTSALNPKAASAKAKDDHSKLVVDHVTQVGLEACRCTHLEEYLPHILNSELCRTMDNRWIIANPIHSLHLASQLDDVQHANSWKQPPLLFGDEEQRTTVLKSQGIAEVWSPLDGYSSSFQDDKKRRPESIPPSRLGGTTIPPMQQTSGSFTPYQQCVSGTTTPPPPNSAPATGHLTPTKTMENSPNPTTTAPELPGSAVPDTTASTMATTATSLVNGNGAREQHKPTETEGVPQTGDRMDVDQTQQPSTSVEAPPASNPSNPNPTASTEAMNGSKDVKVPSTTTDHKPPTIESNLSTTSSPLEENHTNTSKTEDSGATPAEATFSENATTAQTTKDMKNDEDRTQDSLATSTEKRVLDKPETDDSKMDVDVVKSGSSPVSAKKTDEGGSGDPAETSAPAKTSTVPSNGDDLTQSATADESRNCDPAAPSTKATVDDATPAENRNGVKVEGSEIDQAATVTVSSEEPKTENASSPPKAETSGQPSPSFETTARDSLGAANTTDAGAPNAATSSAKPVPEPAPVIIGAPVAAAVTGGEAMAIDPTSSSIAISIPLSPAPSPPPQPHELADEHYHQLKLAENTVRMIRRSIVSYGRVGGKKKSESAKKKRKKDNDFFKSTPVPGWIAPPPREVNSWQEKEWKEARAEGPKRVERWMDQFRLCRECHYDEQRIMQKAIVNENFKKAKNSFYLSPENLIDSIRCCTMCEARSKKQRVGDSGSQKKKSRRRTFMGDELMQCLDCGFIGCGPKSTVPGSHQHMLQHLLISGHKFAVTCGERAQLFCFCCGDFVYHKVFEQEKLRLDYSRHFPKLSWKPHKVQRSFDPFQFMLTDDHGIVWRGPIATYPALVPAEHSSASQLTSRRKAVFKGSVQEKWLATKPNAIALAASQRLLDQEKRFQISAPVGMYNLGNTCFKSAVLHCLIHCEPLQQYFLKEVGHHHKSCQLYRSKMAERIEKEDSQSSISTETLLKKEKIDPECLACEMDRLFLSYYGSTIGKDVLAAIEESGHHLLGEKVRMDVNEPVELEQGEPLVISDFLTATWKSGGMNHLAGYEQRDAHEFLNSFLDLMGKNTRQHRDRVFASINTARDNNAIVVEHQNADPNIVKRVFEGALRSVFLCEECGEKRMLREPFLNISLTLPETTEGLENENGTLGRKDEKLSIEKCLEHFTFPEKLGDPIDCPHCQKRTPTKKQHTFAKLPKVLCLHLKRFDAARNRKIDEFVSFPAEGLNMGPLLSHWCEVSSVPSSYETNTPSAEPRVLYDLFGTVNHVGNMQSGHYVTNVKVKEQWYQCNDAHISLASTDGGEKAVLNNEGAYILFYIRR